MKDFLLFYGVMAILNAFVYSVIVVLVERKRIMNWLNASAAHHDMHRALIVGSQPADTYEVLAMVITRQIEKPPLRVIPYSGIAYRRRPAHRRQQPLRYGGPTKPRLEYEDASNTQSPIMVGSLP